MQDLSIFLTSERMSYTLHLLMAQQASLAQGKDPYCPDDALKKKFFLILFPFFREESQQNRLCADQGNSVRLSDLAPTN